jgi:hypothetical protein
MGTSAKQLSGGCLGQMMAESQKAKGAQPQKGKKGVSGRFSENPPLASQGIDKNLADRARTSSSN